MKVRKGVSPILATVILIAITVAAGLFLYQAFFGDLGIASQSRLVQITSAQLIVPTGSSTGTVTIVIKNSGSSAINNLATNLVAKITTTGSTTLSAVSGSPTNLTPGQSVAMTATGVSAYIGSTYVVLVTATFSDGSTSSTAVSVIGSVA